MVVGDVVTVAGPLIGGSGYTGTYTVTSVTSTTFTYTGSASSTETTVGCGGTVGWTVTLPARSNLLAVAPGFSAVDTAPDTALKPQGLWPTPTSGQAIGPLGTTTWNDSFTDYETVKSTPIIIPESGIPFTTIRVRVKATTTTGVIRFGVYGSNFSGVEPGSLLQEFGSVSVLGGGFAYMLGLGISWTPDEAGVYHLACCVNGGNGTPLVQEVELAPFTHLNGGGPPFLSSKQQTGVTGALPSNGPGLAPTNPTRAPSICLLRWSNVIDVVVLDGKFFVDEKEVSQQEAEALIAADPDVLAERARAVA
jgi:hypothetical protein